MFWIVVRVWFDGVAQVAGAVGTGLALEGLALTSEESERAPRMERPSVLRSRRLVYFLPAL